MSPEWSRKKISVPTKICVQNVNCNNEVSSVIEVKAILQFSTLFNVGDTWTSGEQMFKVG